MKKTTPLRAVSRAQTTPSTMRIQWAVDLGIQSGPYYKFVPSVLRYLLRQAHAIIEPVYVLRLPSDVSTDFTAKWLPEYCSAAEDQLEKLVRGLKIQNTMPPRVIFHPSLSTQGAVDALASDASRSGAHLIIAQTHSRKGVSRMFLGSFAETLLFRSKVPVMLIGKEMNPFHGIRNILFPTDFGKRARAQFAQVLNLARTFDAKVTLFHSIQHPIEPIGAGFYPSGPLGPFSEYVLRQAKHANRRAQAWVDLAERHGIGMNYIIDENGLSVFDQIVALAKKTNAGMIAMEAQSGPVSSTLLGSVTRQVVRHAPCPVLVLKARPVRALALPGADRESTSPKAA